MSNKQRASIRSRKRSNRQSPADQGQLMMDSIYNSVDPDVKYHFDQIFQVECPLCANITRGDDRLTMTAAILLEALLEKQGKGTPNGINRVHMRMGKRFFHLLSPVMQKRFRAEYPHAH